MRGTSGIAGISALGLAGVVILSACVAPAGALNQGVEDRSQDRIEQMRSHFAPAATPDTSYDQIEKLRSRFDLTGPADTSLEQVERTRGAFGPGAATHPTSTPALPAAGDDMSTAAYAATHPTSTPALPAAGDDMSTAAYAATHDH